LEVVFDVDSAGADAVAVVCDLLADLGVAAAGAVVAGALEAALPVHSATPPCPLHAPFFDALVV
jgi:hypothetical protein